jgi:hypothetical protein
MATGSFTIVDSAGWKKVKHYGVLTSADCLGFYKEKDVLACVSIEQLLDAVPSHKNIHNGRTTCSDRRCRRIAAWGAHSRCWQHDLDDFTSRWSINVAGVLTIWHSKGSSFHCCKARLSDAETKKVELPDVIFIW